MCTVVLINNSLRSSLRENKDDLLLRTFEYGPKKVEVEYMERGNV